ncbi:E3 ubiquitin-protein ligase RFWD3 [Sarcoptes scabiei]|nr:E3 ubiquitin-protein ligase RFWD3 [Sarcoptes scabiei]
MVSLASRVLCLRLMMIMVKACLYSEEYGVLQPEVAYVEVGHELVFNCSLMKKYVDDGEIIVSEVFFTQNEVAIDSKYRHKIDDYTVQLKIPNASLTENGVYSCKFNTIDQKTKSICYSDAYIGFKPLKVQSFKCIYFYRQKLYCSWTKPINPIPNTQYSLFHYFEGLESEKKPCGNATIDEENNQQSCFWDHNTSHVIPLHTDKYYLILYGQNVFGITDQPFEYSLTSIVSLPPPRKFQFNKGLLQWIAPENVRLDEKLKNILVYKILVIDQNDQIVKVVNYSSHQNDYHNHSNELTRQPLNFFEFYEIHDLKPNTNYTLNITCKVNDPSNENWSKMASIKITTEAEVPFVSPKMINQSFETVRFFGSNRQVTLYWESLPENEQNGPNFEYLVSYSEKSENSWRNNVTKFPNITLILQSDVEYTFKIYSKNFIGLSKNFSSFVLPTKNDILWYNATNVLINMISVFKFDHGRYDINWTSINPTEVKDYTVFWCMAMDGICFTPIHWHSTSRNQFDLIVSNSHDYKFGISYNNYRGQTTGIIWAKCFVNMLSKKVDGINFSISDISATSVLVHWKLACEAQHAIIDKFHIPYCSKPNQCRTAYADKNTNQYLITDLEPHTTYNITVTSPQSIYKATHIRVKTEYGMPSTPEDFTVELIGKDFNLKWISPESSTIVQHYRLEMIGPQSLTSEFKIKTDFCVNQSCHFEIENKKKLKPYTEYSFFLSACNKHCSEKILQVYRTKPSNPGLMLSPTLTVVDEKLRVHLKPPADPNGPIDSYHVKIYEGTKLYLQNRVEGHRSYVDVNFNTCELLKNNKKYYISVKASNIHDNFELSGNYTEKMQIPMYCPSVYNVLFFTIICLVGFFLLFYLILFYSYKIFKSVKQKNDDFALNIAMEDQSFIEQFNHKTNREIIHPSDESESSFLESNSANANLHDSSNSINGTALLSSVELQSTNEPMTPILSNNTKTLDDSYDNDNIDRRSSSHYLSHQHDINKSQCDSKNYIKFTTKNFHSSHPNVSDLNHHDNLEYFWNQDESRRLLNETLSSYIPKEKSKSNQIMDVHTEQQSLTSSSHSSFPKEIDKNTSSLIKRKSQYSLSSRSSSTSSTKQAYVLIPSSNSNSKYLLHSHTTTHLPESYNWNHV